MQDAREAGVRRRSERAAGRGEMKERTVKNGRRVVDAKGGRWTSCEKKHGRLEGWRAIIGKTDGR
jgi:hypothetical protein